MLLRIEQVEKGIVECTAYDSLQLDMTEAKLLVLKESIKNSKDSFSDLRNESVHRPFPVHITRDFDFILSHRTDGEFVLIFLCSDR
jgi:hypothetical protein